MTNQHFNDYKSKLILEAILKSALCGIAFGFAACFLLGLVFWFVGCDLLWVLIVVTAIVAAASGVVCYFAKFRPDEKTYARRLDRLGLEERLITMVEMDGQDSYMARLQRADARESLAKVDKRQLRFDISKKIALLTASLFTLGAISMTLNVLVHFGYINSLGDILDEQFTEYVTVAYEIEEGGTINGDDIQDIEKGGDTTVVTAVADEGYIFNGWSDGYTDPSRYDQKVMEDIVIVAIFMPMEDQSSDGGDGEGDGDAQGEQNGDGSQQTGDGESQGSPDGEFNPDANTGGGQRVPNNQIIDNETFYKEVLDYYQELVYGEIEESDGLTAEEIEFIKNYLGIV